MPFTGPPAPFRNFGSTIAGYGQRAATALGYKPPPDYIRQVSPTSWPNPGQPIQPVGPRGSNPLSVPFWMGSNLNYQPRPDAEYSAAQLKTLANFPLASICINNVEDQVTQMRWRIQLRQKVGETSQERQKREKGDENIIMLSRFFERPDGFNMWDDWLRPYIDAMLVYDAPSIEVIRRQKSRKIEKLRVVPGHDIVRYITDTGDTPEPPDPAYGQNWEGVPRVLLNTDQLFYRPRNIQPRNTLSSYLYGNSAVAQCAPWIEIGILRLAFVHLYYTTGAVPDMIQVAPPSVTVDKLKEMTMWWNSEFAGQLDKRRGLSIIQGFSEEGKDQFLFPKKDLLADPFDDLLIRYIAFGIGSSPQRLLRPMNRACHSEDTETLTENGWKMYTDIMPGEKIAQFVPDGSRIEFVAPQKMHVYPYSGEMVHFHGKSIDTMVTPEHDMWVSRTDARNNKWRPFVKVKAKDVKGGSTRFRCSAVYDGAEVETFSLPGQKRGDFKLNAQVAEEIKAEPASAWADMESIGARYGVSATTIYHVRKGNRTYDYDSADQPVNMDDWLEFLGYFLSEGGLSHAKQHYLLTLSQKNGPRADKIESCLSRLPFKFKKYPEQADGMVRWNVYGKALCKYLMENTGGYCFNKRIPRAFLSTSIRQRCILFDAMMLGDGAATGESYHSTSPRLASDFQELAFSLGYCAKLHSHQDTRPTISRPRERSYTVNLSRRDTIQTGTGVDHVPYSGTVYCFTVPSGLFITRRKGKIAIHGNSASTSQESAEEEGTAPIVNAAVSRINYLIWFYFGLRDYEIRIDLARESDVVKAATADKIRVDAGLKTRNDILLANGDERDPNPLADELTITTSAGAVPLGLVNTSQGAIPVGEQIQSTSDPATKLTRVERGSYRASEWLKG